MVSFPDISPEIFSFNVLGFNIALRWYAVSYIAGFMCAIFLMKQYIRRPNLWYLKRPPMDCAQAESLLTYLIMGVIFGGRLGYVLFYNIEFYVSNPLAVLRLWDGGMAFHGGFVGVVLAVVIHVKINKNELWSSADLIAIATPLGLLFGRLANFINAELWGRPTSVPWGVVFPGERAQECLNVVGDCARHPSQLYEAGLEGLLLFLILISFSFLGALRKPGLITGVFSLGYGASRFFVEYFRVPDPQFFSGSNPFGYAYQLGGFGVTMGQLLSVPMIFLGLLLIILSSLGFLKINYENT